MPSAYRLQVGCGTLDPVRNQRIDRVLADACAIIVATITAPVDYAVYRQDGNILPRKPFHHSEDAAAPDEIAGNSVRSVTLAHRDLSRFASIH